ncbi:MAG: RidA family protein [Phycisphaeraceae bacterium]
MTSDEIDSKLREMGISWPEPPEAVASYLPCVRDGDHLYISGQLPLAAGELMHRGRVPTQVSLEQAQVAAKQCAINALSLVRREIDGDWSRLRRVIRIGVFVACEAEYDQQAAVANGASTFVADLLGEAGRHARAAVGCAALPLQSPVEVEMLVALHGDA